MFSRRSSPSRPGKSIGGIGAPGGGAGGFIFRDGLGLGLLDNVANDLEASFDSPVEPGPVVTRADQFVKVVQAWRRFGDANLDPALEKFRADDGQRFGVLSVRVVLGQEQKQL